LRKRLHDCAHRCANLGLRGSDVSWRAGARAGGFHVPPLVDICAEAVAGLPDILLQLPYMQLPDRLESIVKARCKARSSGSVL
jgi:hypothetical protein